MEGLGQLNAAFSSPVIDAGVADWGSLVGLELGTAGVEQLGGTDPLLDAEALSRRVVTTPQAAEHTGVAHWSEILNWQHSPMPYLLVVLLLALGVVQLSVAARVGKR
jgi:hypothetical protein